MKLLSYTMHYNRRKPTIHLILRFPLVDTIMGDIFFKDLSKDHVSHKEEWYKNKEIEGCKIKAMQRQG